MKKLALILALLPAILVAQRVMTGGHRGIGSGAPPYTPPTFVAYYSNAPVATGSTTKTSSALTLSSGDFVKVLCSGGLATASYSVSSSPANTFETTGMFNGNSGGSIAGFFAFGVGAGSTTFTCTAASSVNFQGIMVFQYHPGSVATYDSSYMNYVAAQNFTSGALTTSAHGLMTACGHQNFAPSTSTAGSIGANSATLRTLATDAGQCEDTFPTTSQSNITGTITTTGGTSPSWDGEIASFVPGGYWTQPTFDTACNNTPSSSSTTTVSCTIASPTAGDYYVGYCRANNGPTSLVLTSSPSNTFTGIGFQTTGTAGTSEAYYSTSAASGSTTFTCTSNSSVTFQGINVLEYHHGSLTGIDVSDHNGITSSTTTWTSNTFSPTGKGIIVACADPLFGAGAWTLTSGKIGQYTPAARINTSFILCTDTPTGGPVTTITASAVNGNSGSWQGAVIAFK